MRLTMISETVVEVELTADEQAAEKHFDELLDAGWNVASAVRVTRYWCHLLDQKLDQDFWDWLGQ